MENIEKKLLSIRSFDKTELEDLEVFKEDLALLSSQWNFVDHISSFEKVGDYKVYDMLGESIILVKTNDGFSGHLNFCTHRGSTLCTKHSGNTSVFVCPYHHWSFDLNGKLKSAPTRMLTSQDQEKSRLKKVEVKEIEGVLFVGINKDAMAPFEEDVEKSLQPLFSWQGLSNAKIVSKRSFTLKANWKLAIDNFMECYHCYANHPEMCAQLIHPKVTSTDSKIEAEKFGSVWYQWFQSTNALGHPAGGLQDLNVDSEQFSSAFRSVLNQDTPSYGKDGKPLAPLMGKFKDYDNGETFGFSGPLFQFSMPTDHAFMFRINPKSSHETELELFWLVDDNAVEDKDFTIKDLTWFWSTTMQQDITAIERASLGTRSRFYEPGNYTKLENNSARFAMWYRRKISKQHVKEL